MTRRDWALLTVNPVSTQACIAAAGIVDPEIVVGALWSGGGFYVQQPSSRAELTFVQSTRIGSWPSLGSLLPAGYADRAESAGAAWWTEIHSNGWEPGRAELLLAGIARLSEGWVVPLGGGDGEFSPL
ncbi:hypothetical protein C5B85_08965 [Pseudoclavibacter sp. AY1F1]|nr:hypothetical protein C5B85_08965 [Pseudoclavibacter sp. AY1F1]